MAPYYLQLFFFLNFEVRYAVQVCLLKVGVHFPTEIILWIMTNFLEKPTSLFNPPIIRSMLGTSLAIPWFRLRASNAGSAVSVPDWGTKIPHASWHCQKISKSNKIKNQIVILKVCQWELTGLQKLVTWHSRDALLTTGQFHPFFASPW